MNTYLRFIIVGAINLHKALLRQTQYFLIYFTVTCSSTHTDYTVVFSLQNRLRERAEMLHYITLPILFYST
jgi:hypothetical protein